MELQEVKNLWSQIFEIVKGKVDSVVGLNVHMKDAKGFDMTDSEFIIAVPMTLNKNMILLRYKDDIEAAIEQVTSQKLSLKIILFSEMDKQVLHFDKNETVIEIDENDTSKLNPKYTFENYIVGPSNVYATNASIATAEEPGLYNPLFLYGNSGLGKTHLLYAIGNRIRKNKPSSNILYVTSEDFTNEFIDSLREKKGMDFKKKYRSVDALLVDDIQFLKDKEQTQEEFFHTFNELYGLNKQIVITSDRPPKELLTLTDRLRTRFSQGLLIDIGVPNYETRVAILQKKAFLMRKQVDNEVLGYIAERVKSNVRELEGVLIKLMSISEISNQTIDLSLAEYVVKSYITSSTKNKITLEKVMDKVSSYYNVSVDDLKSKSRISNITVPRQVAMYICSKYAEGNYTAIGKIFGGKDRTTVLHNVRKIEDDIQTDENLKADVDYIVKDLQSF